MHRTMKQTIWAVAACVLVSGAWAQSGSYPGSGGGTRAPQPAAPRYPQQPPTSNPQRPSTGDALDRQMQWERRDMGVPPTRELHTGPAHAPTPASIPGGQIITTKGLVALLNPQSGMPVVVLDVLGGSQTLPNARPAVVASQAGSFNDETQRMFGQYLQQLTNNNRETPIVLYCASAECWMSYNAALRAIRLGYTNVLWYRGGLEAWQQAGLQTVPANNPQYGQQGNGYGRNGG